jgi:hypothetical protein
MPRAANIQARRDTAANWTSTNPTLAAGEFGLETDTLKLKLGNGSAAWNSLAYVGSGTSDNALKLDGRKLYVQSSAPSSGMVAGDLWIKS